MGVGGAVAVLSFRYNHSYFTKQFAYIQAGVYVGVIPYKAHIYSRFFVLWQLDQEFLHVWKSQIFFPCKSASLSQNEQVEYPSFELELKFM